MIKIDGQVFTPFSYKVGIYDISDAKRNAFGDILIDRIATKRKLELTWRYLDREELARLLAAVRPIFFQVTYPDPEENMEKTGTFYVGDRFVNAFDYKNGKIRWRDISFNLIER